MTPNTQQRGFTLIELMIVVVIVGILAAVSYPTYRDSIRKSRRSDAQAALMRGANEQERFFSWCGRYAQTISGTRNCTAGNAAAGTDRLGIETTSADERYTLAVAQGSTSGNCSGGAANWNCGFTLYAIPVANGSQDGDGTFRIDATGRKQWAKDGNNSNYTTANYNYKWTDR